MFLCKKGNASKKNLYWQVHKWFKKQNKTILYISQYRLQGPSFRESVQYLWNNICIKKKKKTPRVNPNVNCGLWAVTTCQCRFSNCNKCATTLVRDVDKAESYACVGSGGMLKISVPSIQLCCELKTSLLKSLFKKKTKMLN